MRLVVISNRLPFTVSSRHRLVDFSPSAGGLATGLSSYLERSITTSAGIDEYVWVGWPGNAVPKHARAAVIARARTDYRAHPVFIGPAEMERFYHGFCNQVLWPLFHYFPSYCHYHEGNWREYQRINRVFRDAVLEVAGAGDVIWVHDYHLMLLPRLLREAGVPRSRIGFFLHIPFPSLDVFRLMPRSWAAAIVDGMLGADVVGFHTEDYASNFRATAGVLASDRAALDRAIITAVPMGIDVARFADAVDSPAVKQRRTEIAASTRGNQVILSMDRLDYSKGIVTRLNAFERFLERHPRSHGRVVLMAIVIPSRVAVQHYDQLKHQIDETVGRINGRFGRFDWVPIVYQYRSLSFEELIAAYASADVALVTPIRDGMNLIAKEYVAARRGGPGCLILSEMAGAARELTGAMLVNPNDVPEMADAIARGLAQSRGAQVRRNAAMLEWLKAHDVYHWARTFLGTLTEASGGPRARSVRAPARVAEEHVRPRRARSRPVDGHSIGSVPGAAPVARSRAPARCPSTSNRIVCACARAWSG